MREGGDTARLMMSEQFRAKDMSTTTCDVRVRKARLYLRTQNKSPADGKNTTNIIMLGKAEAGSARQVNVT